MNEHHYGTLSALSIQMYVNALTYGLCLRKKKSEKVLANNTGDRSCELMLPEEAALILAG